MKVYGPYTNKEGRKLVIIHKEGKSKTTQYARFLLEQKLGRSLEYDETVDHIDGDFRNDALSNLQILSRRENAKKSAKKPTLLKLCCPVCNKTFEKRASRVKHNKKQGKSGPYCGKKCAGSVRSSSRA